MDIGNFEKMDPHMLLGIINTALRNSGESLDDLCHLHDVEREALERHLASANYEYRADLNQFR